MKILLATSTADAKTDKITKQLIDNCKKRNIDVEVITANIFTADMKQVEEKEKPDVIVLVGTKKIETELPVINGLALVYPWMGIDKLLDEIEKYKK